MTKDYTPDLWGKSVPELMAEAGKMLDEAPVPTEGRILYNPKTGELMKRPETNKYPVTRGDAP